MGQTGMAGAQGFTLMMGREERKWEEEEDGGQGDLVGWGPGRKGEVSIALPAC